MLRLQFAMRSGCTIRVELRRKLPLTHPLTGTSTREAARAESDLVSLPLTAHLTIPRRHQIRLISCVLTATSH
jgi:hypothetical protein